MAFIEKFEIDELKLSLKNPYTYLVFAIFATPVFFVSSIYSTYFMLLLAFIFAVIFIIDIKEYIIPDTTQILVFLTTILLLYITPGLNILEHIIGLVFASFMFGGIYAVYEFVLKRPALGFGDVKLFANVGLLLGFFSFNYFLWILSVSSIVFIIIKKIKLNKKDNNKLIPYGPFIVVSAWVCLLFNSFFEQAYMNIMMKLFS
jgi:leader peptidase (prepilin peptidase)/N-methyltransferase